MYFVCSLDKHLFCTEKRRTSASTVSPSRVLSATLSSSTNSSSTLPPSTASSTVSSSGTRFTEIELDGHAIVMDFDEDHTEPIDDGSASESESSASTSPSTPKKGLVYFCEGVLFLYADWSIVVDPVKARHDVVAARQARRDARRTKGGIGVCSVYQ